MHSHEHAFGWGYDEYGIHWMCNLGLPWIDNMIVWSQYAYVSTLVISCLIAVLDEIIWYAW